MSFLYCVKGYPSALTSMTFVSTKGSGICTVTPNLTHSPMGDAFLQDFPLYKGLEIWPLLSFAPPHIVCTDICFGCFNVTNGFRDTLFFSVLSIFVTVSPELKSNLQAYLINILRGLCAQFN